jgi:hypothetical protein
MTLTTILPSLRRSIPDPLSIDRWPEHTVATTTDVLVAGVSMVRLVDVCGTPCVHTAAPVIPGTHGRPALVGQACVVVVRVMGVKRSDTASPVEPMTGLSIRLDGDLGQAHAVAAEARLVGRASTARRVPAVCGRSGAPDLALTVPGDLVVGDLLAVPCEGSVALRDVRSLHDC